MLTDQLLAPMLLALTLFTAPAGAGAAQHAEEEIRARLAKWTQDFNAGKADAVCSLFSPELRYDFRGYPERGYADICARLTRSLADSSKRYAYALDVREILVSGDIAVVRLVWTLTVTLGVGDLGGAGHGRLSQRARWGLENYPLPRLRGARARRSCSGELKFCRVMFEVVDLALCRFQKQEVSHES